MWDCTLEGNLFEVIALNTGEHGDDLRPDTSCMSNAGVCMRKFLLD